MPTIAAIAAMLATAAYVVGYVVVLVWESTLHNLPAGLYWTLIGLAFPLGLPWLAWAWLQRRKSLLAAWAAATVVYVLWWPLAVQVTEYFGWGVLRANLARWGTLVLFTIGLCWTVRLVEWASKRVRRRAEQRQATGGRIWNPLDPNAWYYGRQNNRKLNQSVATLVSYTLAFALAMLVVTNLQGCREIYELPAGGGEQKTIAQTVKVQKVIRKKYVVNPFSAIKFDERIIDDVKLQLLELTEHAYTIGQGAGSGAGFGGGTPTGRVRLIRLEYPGGDWDLNFGIGGDYNMLMEYGIRTTHKVAKKTESRRVAELKNFPVGKSPPLVYLTGQGSINLSNNDVKVLREYLLDKHGMLFGDNGGSRHFHNQFLAMMNRVLPEVRPVIVPRDDIIHRVPYAVPKLPYVAPHGGEHPLGWYLDGRWVCYYHPGDIGDAWADRHAGVKPEIYESCYQLGTNIIFYAHAEYSRWVQARKNQP